MRIKHYLIILCFCLLAWVNATATPCEQNLKIDVSKLKKSGPNTFNICAAKGVTVAITVKAYAAKYNITKSDDGKYPAPTLNGGATPTTATFTLSDKLEGATGSFTCNLVYSPVVGKPVKYQIAFTLATTAPTPPPVVSPAPAAVTSCVNEVKVSEEQLTTAGITIPFTVCNTGGVTVTLTTKNTDASQYEISGATDNSYTGPKLMAAASKTNATFDFGGNLNNVTTDRIYTLKNKVSEITYLLKLNIIKPATPAIAVIMLYDFSLTAAVRVNAGCKTCYNGADCTPDYTTNPGFQLVYNPCCGKIAYNDKDGNKKTAPTQNQLYEVVPKSLKPNALPETKSILDRRKIYAVHGMGFTFDVLNVNPYKYYVNVSSSSVNYNEQDAMILYNFLHTYVNKINPTAAGDNQELKTNILEMGRKFSEYILQYQYGPDCIDMKQLEQERNALIGNALSIFHSLGVPEGNLIDQLKIMLAKDSDYKADDPKNLYVNAMATYTILYNMSFRYNYQIPTVPDKDGIIYNLSINPKDTAQKSGYHIQNQHIYIPIKGGFKIDGSVGVFYSGLHNDTYYGRTDSIITYTGTNHAATVIKGTRIVGDRSDVFKLGNNQYRGGEFGVMAQTHFYSRISRNFNISFSAGIGMTFEKTPQPRGLVGGSLLLGHKNRIAITGGAIFGPVQRLDPQYAGPGLYTIPSGGSITTTKVEASAFLGISYNFNFATPKGSTLDGGNGTPAPGTPGTPGKSGSKQ